MPHFMVKIWLGKASAATSNIRSKNMPNSVLVFGVGFRDSRIKALLHNVE